MRRLLLASAFLASFAFQPAMAEEFTKAQIEEIVRQYIADHPQELVDSVQRLQDQKVKAEDAASVKIINDNRNWLEKNKNHAEAGNPKGDVTIVEFFDYNCGYCKQALADLMTLLDKDKNVRLVFVEIPILGDSSILAAQWALAAKAQDGNYLAYHTALMKNRGPLNDETLKNHAKAAGLDIARLEKDRTDPKINDIISENLNMARAVGIQGTPAFIIGDQVIRGYVGIEGLTEAVANARKAKAEKK